MREVARAARVAVSTVSKALRNDPTIPEKRCLAIQALAKKLGYQPNPLVSTLMAQIHHHRRRSDPLNLAWVNLWPEDADSTLAMDAKPLLAGSRERAQELGYGVEVYSAGRESISPVRLRRILMTCGQWGLIFPPVPKTAINYDFDLRGFAAVTIGTSLQTPRMHRVSPNHFQGSSLTFARLRDKGFQRIGLVLTPEMNERVELKWLGAFLASQNGLPSKNRVSPLIVPCSQPERLSRWLLREKPDAIITADNVAWIESNSALEKLPVKPFMASLMRTKPHVACGGLNLRPNELGRVAVEMVVAQIHRNERGSPTNPHTILIDSSWE